MRLLSCIALYLNIFHLEYIINCKKPTFHIHCMPQCKASLEIAHIPRTLLEKKVFVGFLKITNPQFYTDARGVSEIDQYVKHPSEY